MRLSSILLIVVMAVSACAKPVSPPEGSLAAQPTDCRLIAAIAREQYGYDETMTLLLNRDGYVPRCEWQALGLDVEVVAVDRLDFLAPWLRFARPRQSGRQRVVNVTHWMGVHLYERDCRLRREGEQWRLVEACTLTWSF